MSRPNTVLWGLIAGGAALALARTVLGAAAYGRRREHRAWPTGRGETA